MALKTSRSIDELSSLCDELGIESWFCAGKTDYLILLRNYYLNSIYGTNQIKDLPIWLQVALCMDSPYLCKRFDSVPINDQESLLNDTKTIVDQKIDGCRMLLCFTRDKSGYGDIEFNAFGRNNSVKTFLPINYGEKIRLGNKDIYAKLDQAFSPSDKGCVLDCEIVCTKSNVQTSSKARLTTTQLQSTAALLATDKDVTLKAQEDAPFEFVVFDAVYAYGVNITNKPIELRRQIANDYVEVLNKIGINARMVESKTGITKTEKLKMFDDIVKAGGEGIVLKRTGTTYNSEGNRDNNWVKLKRTMSGSIGDTVDMFVIGCEWGTLGKARETQLASLKLGMYVDGYETHTATVCNFTDAEREDITINYVRKYKGRVCEVDAQDVSGRNKLFMHAKFIKWRDDKQKVQCSITQSELDKFIL